MPSRLYLSFAVGKLPAAVIGSCYCIVILHIPDAPVHCSKCQYGLSLAIICFSQMDSNMFIIALLRANRELRCEDAANVDELSNNRYTTVVFN